MPQLWRNSKDTRETSRIGVANWFNGAWALGLGVPRLSQGGQGAGLRSAWLRSQTETPPVLKARSSPETLAGRQPP